MSLQKAVHLFRQFLADAFGGCNFFDARFAQSLDRSEFSQEKIFAVLAHAGTIIEDAFADPFFHQQLVIGIRETVRFVADALEQTQRAGIGRQLQRHRAARPVNFFKLFCEPDDRKIVKAEPLKFATGGGELAFATIDNDEIRQADQWCRAPNTVLAPKVVILSGAKDLTSVRVRRRT